MKLERIQYFQQRFLDAAGPDRYDPDRDERLEDTVPMTARELDELVSEIFRLREVIYAAKRAVENKVDP